jgi:hypothetical protein
LLAVQFVFGFVVVDYGFSEIVHLVVLVVVTVFFWIVAVVFFAHPIYGEFLNIIRRR